MNSPLIPAAELTQLLADGVPVVLWDVRWYLPTPERGEQEYREGHLAGAHFVGVESDLSSPAREDRIGGRHPLPTPEQVQAALDRTGVSQDSLVVVYDQGPGLGAARAWWVLRDAGVGQVRVLNGGVNAWLAAGGTLTAEPSVAATVAPERRVVAEPGQLDQVDSFALVQAQAAGATVVDVRAAERYRGETEPMDQVAGHIPGAINLPATELAGPNGFAPVAELAKRLAHLKPGDVFSCGSGITAAQALLAAEAAGIGGLRIYPGSWSDWVSDRSRPIDQG